MSAVIAVVLAAALAEAPAPPAPPVPLALAVPLVRQEPERCGPAALEMVLAYLGAGAERRAASARAYDPVLRGALITDLAAAARRAGYSARIETLGIDDLPPLLEQGVPPILLYERGIGPVSRLHYGVVVGWDPTAREFTLHDGSARPRRVSREALARSWMGAGQRALVVRPEGS